MHYTKGKTLESKFISRTSLVFLILFFITILTPLIGYSTGILDAEQVAKISESNPYQSLIWILSSCLVACGTALGIVYKSNITQVKEQYIILDKLSDNIAAQTNAITKNQEVISKSLDSVNGKLQEHPCLLDSSILKDLLKKK